MGGSDYYQSHTSIHRTILTTQPRPILRPVSPLLQSTTPLRPETGCIYPNPNYLYGTNNVTNNTAELLARILACGLISPHTPTIIIYISTVVYSQYMVLVGITFTHRQLTRTMFPIISRMLAQRVEESQTGTLPHHDSSTSLLTPILIGPLTLHETIVLQIGQMGHCGKKWSPIRHATVMGAQLFVKIKSHQHRPNGTQKYNTGSQSCLALVHKNHWVDKTYELPFSVHSSPPFPLNCTHSRITSPFTTIPCTCYMVSIPWIPMYPTF